MGSPSGDGRALSRRRFLESSAIAGLALMSGEAAATPAAMSTGAPRRELPFDDDWRFIRADIPGAERPAYDHAGWERVTLPHDWSIEDLPLAPKTTAPWIAPAATWTESPLERATPYAIAIPPASPDGPPLRVGPFDALASAGASATGWTVGGAGWYRKTFRQPAMRPGERAEIRFDGAYRDTEVWLNGVSLGANVYGYGAFTFDLTPFLRPGGDNVLAVRVRNEGETSRWYSGSGLYRHVWLTITGPVKIAPFGVWVQTPRIQADAATVKVAVEITNTLTTRKSVEVKVVVRDPSGKLVTEGGGSQDLAAHAGGQVTVVLNLPEPRLWGPDDPVLYQAEVILLSGGRPTDRTVTRFGVRTIAASPEQGLTINGVPVKLRGACLHADNGILGANAIDRAEIRKVALLKSYGYNALRMGHQMFSPAFMNACDEAGMLVVDEVFDTWEQPKVKNDYSRYFADHWKDDLARMVRQHRNHPSVIFWSIGNEIPEAALPRGVEIAARLRSAVLDLDPSRLITGAIPVPLLFGADGEIARRGLDVAGYNYGQETYEEDHKNYPRVVMMGTEQWTRDIHDGWRKVEAHPYVIGEFVWSGMDYIGEAGSGSSELRKIGAELPKTASIELARTTYVSSLWDYPAYLSGCGEIDINGKRKPQGLYRDVLWGRSPLELLVQRPLPAGTYERLSDWGWHDELESWTWPELESGVATVRAYTTGDRVKLVLNGREVADKRLTAQDRLKAEFEIPYQRGALMAVAYRNGVEIGRKTLETVGPAAKLRLRAERPRIDASVDDLGYVVVEVCDAQGRKAPDAMVAVTFSVTGAARLRATGSANPRGLKSFRSPDCTTFQGEALAIVQPGVRSGECLVRATAPGLAQAELIVAVG
jgi:beta-galactosidase